MDFIGYVQALIDVVNSIRDLVEANTQAGGKLALISQRLDIVSSILQKKDADVIRNKIEDQLRDIGAILQHFRDELRSSSKLKRVSAFISAKDRLAELQDVDARLNDIVQIINTYSAVDSNNALLKIAKKNWWDKRNLGLTQPAAVVANAMIFEKQYNKDIVTLIIEFLHHLSNWGFQKTINAKTNFIMDDHNQNHHNENSTALNNIERSQFLYMTNNFGSMKQIYNACLKCQQEKLPLTCGCIVLAPILSKSQAFTVEITQTSQYIEKQLEMEKLFMDPVLLHYARQSREKLRDQIMETKNQIQKQEKILRKVTKEYPSGIYPGTIQGTVFEGKHLPANDSGGTSDPYVIIQYGAAKRETPTIKKTINPKWDTPFSIEVIPDNKETNIKFTVYDWNKYSSNVALGDVTLSIKEIGAKRKGWFKLQNVKIPTERSSKILMELEYICEAVEAETTISELESTLVMMEEILQMAESNVAIRESKLKDMEEMKKKQVLNVKNVVDLWKEEERKKKELEEHRKRTEMYHPKAQHVVETNIQREDRATSRDRERKQLLKKNFNKAYFKGSYHSCLVEYNENMPGLQTQLDDGITFLDISIFTSDFLKQGDFVLGLNDPGKLVNTGKDGNPNTTKFSDWLDIIVFWMKKEPYHLPVVLCLNVRDGGLLLAKNSKSGNFMTLHDILNAKFGPKLFSPQDLVKGTWPTVDEMIGRVAVVLTGVPQIPYGYRKTKGCEPAVSVNILGQVVVVYEHSYRLFYWTGKYLKDGKIQWMRHGKFANGAFPAVSITDSGTVVIVYESGDRLTSELMCLTGQLDPLTMDIEWSQYGERMYDKGSTPCIAVRNDGFVVEVHKSQNNNVLWYHVGQIDESKLITFGHSQTFPSKGQGKFPSVQVNDESVKEIHSCPKSGKSYFWEASIKKKTDKILSVFHHQNNQEKTVKLPWNVFTHCQTTEESTKNFCQFTFTDKSKHSLKITTTEDSTLWYTTSEGVTGDIRCDQLCFVDIQGTTDGLMKDTTAHPQDYHFFSCTADYDPFFLIKWKKQNKIVRLLRFNDEWFGKIKEDVAPLAAMTDFPDSPAFEEWYKKVLQAASEQ